MSKWIRVESNKAQEIITYDPNGVINESFLPLFKGPFTDDYSVEVGYDYDAGSNSFSEPTPEEVDPTPVPPGPEPEVYVSVEEFRGQLTLSEKLIWDNPSGATTAQSNAINTVRQDFPHRVDSDEFLEELNLLETTEVIGTGRAATLNTYFSSL